MKRALLCLSLLVVGACRDAEAPAKCEAFRDAYCEKQAELCEAMEGACRALFDETVPCGDAVGVDDAYDDCMEEVAALDRCPPDLPSSCRGVVVMPRE